MFTCTTEDRSHCHDEYFCIVRITLQENIKKKEKEKMKRKKTKQKKKKEKKNKAKEKKKEKKKQKKKKDITKKKKKKNLQNENKRTYLKMLCKDGVDMFSDLSPFILNGESSHGLRNAKLYYWVKSIQSCSYF